MTQIKRIYTDSIRANQSYQRHQCSIHLLLHHFHPFSIHAGSDAVVIHCFAIGSR